MKEFKNKTVLVTGGTGSIGSEIVRQLLKSEAKQIRVFSRDEHKQHELAQELGQDERLRYLIGDVRDRDRLESVFRDVDVCFHAAALKHVPACEYNPFEAVKTNIIGAQNIIETSIKHNLEKVIAISTDKAVSPESVLGASKLMMERLITAANLTTGPRRTRFSSVRFGNVLKRAMRYFMEIPDAVRLIFDAAQLMKGGEIFVLKMKQRSIVEFAREVIERCGGKNIALSFIGLRPGEKINEELLTAEEKTHTIEKKNLFIILPLAIVSWEGATPPERRTKAAKR